MPEIYRITTIFTKNFLENSVAFVVVYCAQTLPLSFVQNGEFIYVTKICFEKQWPRCYNNERYIN